MEFCPAEHFNSSIDEFQEVCPNNDFAINVNAEEKIHALPCYDMEQFNKTDFTSVLLINTTQLVSHLGTHKAGMCAVVLFYASWCPFSIKMALFYNVLGRLYPGIPIFAVEIESQVYGFAANQHRYGVISIPNLLVFQGPRAIGKYNLTEPSVAKFVEFMGKFMNLSDYDEPFRNCSSEGENADDTCIIGSRFQPTDQDHLGPISIELKEHTDWLLLVSICFLIVVAYSKYKSR